ncbi:DEAD/DEAH box helicase [Roseovarius nubinhibens]|uniref:DEAD/DEAH box helicase n=1 Tax=Roseovarius nubinhibens TaxID=314263 RepID=UPI001C09D72A|nr:DEAD/DEAH box helicase [Roseovarius nubinhibens]MBU3001713.1 DEAD/DEAH box helicase [Roseovarius nubinhibens]
MTTFDTLGLTEPLKAIKAEGYLASPAIQGEANPLRLSKCDVIGMAQTGTGKASSFVLPIWHRIESEKSKAAPKQCKALVLPSNRELAARIVANISAYSQFNHQKCMRPKLFCVS